MLFHILRLILVRGKMIIPFIDSIRTKFYAISIIFLIPFIIKSGYGATNEQFGNCSHLYNCGNIRGIGYPFWGGERPSYCGSQEFLLECLRDQNTTILRTPNYVNQNYYYMVLGINQSIPKMTMVLSIFRQGTCPHVSYKDIALPSFSFNTERSVQMINVFYGCTSEVMSKVQIPSNVTCEWSNGESGVFFAHTYVSDVAGCNFSLSFPISLTAYNDLWDRKMNLATALDQSLDVQYNLDGLAACSDCEASGGKCGSNSRNQFICICPDESYPTHCPNSTGSIGLQKLIIIGATMAGTVLLSACFIIWWYCRNRQRLNGSILALCKGKTIDNQNLEAFIKKHGYLTPRRYSYSNIKKMTHSFRDKLGEGGYSDVYKGYLSNGVPVAVKILKTTKGNGEEFINEVASISKTSHVNVVTLLGFCLEGSKRALIYEFLSNGSLENFINKECEVHLELERMYEIAIGIARGLEYLHRGCNTRILHFDIKPHNILLDEEFCPRISDFGLAKLCARKESIVSMQGARGTIGYIAPEVFSRNFGEVSYKSDVYSYGMMILEMVGGRRNAINGQMSNSSEAYFPRWAYERVMLDEDLKLKDNVMTEDENEIARKMIIVGLWCIQTVPSQRPTMSKVIDMLEGGLAEMEVPPKPFLCSPSRSGRMSLVTAVGPLETTKSSPSVSTAASYTISIET